MLYQLNSDPVQDVRENHTNTDMFVNVPMSKTIMTKKTVVTWYQANIQDSY